MTGRKGSARPGGGKASDTQKVSADSRAAAAKFPIVGLGASAGGLEAFELVQHLDPSHASILTEILQHSTAMPVVEAQDQMRVMPNRVHVIRPNIAQDVSPERLRRFFVKEDSGYRVKKEIREMVVFAVQRVIKDPPFTRLDLLTCRNLMIYLEPELQSRLIPAFHYALKPGGVLFLSPSESVGSHTELFEPISRKWKIYRARPTVASTRAVLSSGLSWAADGGGRTQHDLRPITREPQIADLARRTLLQSFAPAAVVTDLQGNILYVHGETGKFLRPAPGHPTHNVVEMARDGLQIDLREALQLATSQGVATQNRELSVKTERDEQALSLSVRPMPDPEGRLNMLLVSFQERALPTPPVPARKSRSKVSEEAHRIAALERELSQAKESMTAMLEEQQASNEELKSTNEELVTVNSELQTKIEQMANMQDDMKNLLDNIRVGTIFLDRHLRIRRFTRDATKVYRLASMDVGRHLADIRSELQDVDLLADAQAVLDSLVPIEREVRTAAGVWYLARIQPYRTVDNMIDGVVLTFADVTERVQAIVSREARELAEAVVNTVREPLIVLDVGLNVISVNQPFCQAFAVRQADIVGHSIFEFGHRQWDFAAMHDLLENVLPRAHSFEHQVVTHDFGGSTRQLQLSARRVIEKTGAGNLVLLVVEGIVPIEAVA